MGYTYLGQLNTSEDLRRLRPEECTLLCNEIRQELISRVTENGGHLASNLGVVELTLALHRVFDLPKDRIIFDVGHQSYVHKLLSGRFDRFSGLRSAGGLSGFQRREESPFDPFGGGHASTSLSAALGFAEADKLAGRDNFTVAVVGDGAFTGGMIHEALNNCTEDLRLIIILNENEMSISRNTGHFAALISRIRSAKSYFGLKKRVKKLLSPTSAGRWVIRRCSKLKARIKRILYAENYFEQMGVQYSGPIDGHNLEKLELLFSEAKQKGGCTLIHVRTVKGKGYREAEENPGRFHGLSPKGTPVVPTFSAHFGEYLTALAQEDRDICAITAAMADGTGLIPFKNRFPERFFDVGIAEEHALTFAAALSAAGKKPVFAVYSTFLQRCYDQLIHDAALQRLPLTLAVDRAGIASKDGPTHHGLFDVSIALSLPDSSIYAPLDFPAQQALLQKSLAENRISFLRYRSGGEVSSAGKLPYIYKEDFLRGDVEKDPDGVIITYGGYAEAVLKVKKKAAKKGVRLSVLVPESLRLTEPLKEKILRLLPAGKTVLFVEEGIYNGGAALYYQEILKNDLTKMQISFDILAVKDPFLLPSAGQSYPEVLGIGEKDILKKFGLSPEY